MAPAWVGKDWATLPPSPPAPSPHFHAHAASVRG